MRGFRAIAVTAAVLAIAMPLSAAPSALDVLGVVTNAARPVGDALVIAMNLQDLATVQTWSASDGTFSLPKLRSGIYKVIAVKQGFAPAITTIVPSQQTHRVNLKLKTGRDAQKSVAQDMWELRASLPSDVLREVEAMVEVTRVPEETAPRFSGEMLSMAGVANTEADAAFARTAVGVEGRTNSGWKLGVRGDVQRFEPRAEELALDGPVAESSGMSMEFRSPGDSGQRYRVASTRSSWMYATPLEQGRQVDLKAHNFEWQRGPAMLQVRYFEQQNLFPGLPFGSNLVELSGNMPLLHSERNDLGLQLRVMQQTVESTENAFRRADVAANGSLELVPSLLLQYGMASRIGREGQEWAPRTGAEWKISEQTSFIGTAMVKVVDRDPGVVALPTIVFWTDNGRELPQYAYTFGFVTGDDETSRFSAVASVEAIDEPVRMIFADAENQFWDGVLLEAGDIRRDIRLAYRKQFGDLVAIDVAASAGTASQADPPPGVRAKVFVAGDLQSTFRPTGTTLAVSYRDIQQPRENGEDEYRAERLHVRMAQSLYLPVDVKLLLGLELARAENSPYLVDSYEQEGRSKKYIGGLALNF